MTPYHMTAQTPAPAQAPPRIPAMPPAPGARTAAQAAQDAATAAQDAANAAQQLASDALREEATTQGTPAPAPGPQPRAGDGQLTTSTGLPVDPEAILRESQPIVGMAMVMVVAIFVGFPLVRAFARRMDKRAELGTVRAQDLMPQIRQLQESVDAMTLELERISEAQRFQAKLMAEKAPALPSRESQG